MAVFSSALETLRADAAGLAQSLKPEVAPQGVAEPVTQRLQQAATGFMDIFTGGTHPELTKLATLPSRALTAIPGGTGPNGGTSVVNSTALRPAPVPSLPDRLRAAARNLGKL